jgi:2-polyprenyl-3-methyl-5-hydroxy-6-metoxy-1,4-benzoquinol methylase
MPETRSISEVPSELFGFAALVHGYKKRGEKVVAGALRECGLQAPEEMIREAMEDWQLELRSDIDGSFPEQLDYYFESIDEMAYPTRAALRLAMEVCPSGRVLDIGCGAGRFLKVFAERGYEVTGIEVSDLLVWICRNLVNAKVFKMGIEEVDASFGRFDVQLLLGHNLGIGANPEGVRAIFGSCAQRSNPGGLLVLSSIDMNASQEEYARSRLRYNLKSGAVHHGQTEYWLEYGPLSTGKFRWIHISHGEAEGWARPFGWRSIGHWLDPEEDGHWCSVFRLG